MSITFSNFVKRVGSTEQTVEPTLRLIVSTLSYYMSRRFTSKGELPTIGKLSFIEHYAVLSLIVQMCGGCLYCYYQSQC